MRISETFSSVRIRCDTISFSGCPHFDTRVEGSNTVVQREQGMKIIEEGPNMLQSGADSRSVGEERPRRMARDLLLFKKGSLEESHENRCTLVFFYRGSMRYYMDLSVFEADSPGRAFS